jgi:hypothetical protein
VSDDEGASPRQQEECEEAEWAERMTHLHPSLRAWPGKRKEIMSVYKKLSMARERFHKLKLTKTGRNTFAQYNYFELGDFLIPALEVFREVGLIAYVSFDADTATMTIVDLETDSKMTITSPMGSAALKGCHEVQNIGAVETYQRRYLWVAALEIVEHDALDATTGKAEPERRLNATKPIKEDRETIIQLAASIAIEKFKKGDELGASEDISGLTENEEKLRLWQYLSGESKFRTFIKKHAQELREKEAEPA